MIRDRLILRTICIVTALALLFAAAASADSAGSDSDSNDGSRTVDAAASVQEGVSVAGMCPVVFSHWNTEPDGSGVDYYPLDEVGPDGSVTLYAQYIQRPVVSCTVTKITDNGDAVLDLTKDQLASARILPGDLLRIRSGIYSAVVPYYTGRYTEEIMFLAKTDQSPAVILIKKGDFSARSGIAAGDSVTVELVERAGAKALQLYYNLNVVSGRENYASDSDFGNFRELTLGTIAPHKLYRSAHPLVNTEKGRTIEKLMEEAGIRTVLNMANSKKDLEKNLKKKEFRSTWYAKLKKAGNVFARKFSWSYFSPEFAKEFVKGMTFLAAHQPPYLIHCNGGRDRTGFASILLGMLMGAGKEEILLDYMRTYSNYFHLYEGMEVWDLVYHLRGEKMMNELISLYGDGTDLQSAARNYLLRNGMDPKKLDTLVQKLEGR